MMTKKSKNSLAKIAEDDVKKVDLNEAADVVAKIFAKKIQGVNKGKKSQSGRLIKNSDPRSVFVTAIDRYEMTKVHLSKLVSKVL
jgi:GTP cyclohydrolase I